MHLTAQPNAKRRETLAVVEALIAISLWGISFISIKLALADVSPVTLIVLRFAMGALIVGAVAWRRGEFARLAWRDLPALASVGLIGITLQQILQVTGQDSADASVAAFLAATAPAFTVALAAFVLREKPRAWQIAGIALATAGAITVATNGDWGALARGNFGAPGNIFVLLSSVVWAVLTIQSKSVVSNRPATFVTAAMFFFGALFAAPVFIYQQGWRELAASRVSLTGWGAILFTGVVCTAGAYLLNTHALKHIPASRVALIQNLEPLVAVIAAGAILGESITLAMALGGAAILGGVFLAERTAPVQAEPEAVQAANAAGD